MTLARRSRLESMASSCPITVADRSTMQLPSPDALVAIREAVGSQSTILLDSGIRSGTDVLIALALGANACLLGRPYVYGLALGGADGVRQVVENIVAELDLTMGLLVSGLSRISPAIFSCRLPDD
jgi:isopentenyl diphosphate isomerase/L-lactate dehydrogenase-like FMN-dependent dehydrogenase